MASVTIRSIGLSKQSVLWQGCFEWRLEFVVVTGSKRADCVLDEPSMDKVAVVMPWFQRHRGIMRPTMEAVFRQDSSFSIEVVIVDDGSPVPAEAELADLVPSPHVRWRVVRQENRGPAAARNAALSLVRPDTAWVALLDSDDTWADFHLSRAVKSLRAGHDFFFADHIREPLTKSQFQIAQFDPSGHHCLDDGSFVFSYVGNFFTQLVRHSPVGTSTVVMRWSALRSLRFSEDIGLCDDLIFWLDAATQGARAAFGSDIHVVLRSGVNISVAEAWNSNRALANLWAFSKYRTTIERKYELTAEQEQINTKRMTANRKTFCRALIGLVGTGRGPRLQTLLGFINQEPVILFDLAKMVLARISTGAQRLLRLSSLRAPYNRTLTRPETDLVLPIRQDLS